MQSVSIYLEGKPMKKSSYSGIAMPAKQDKKPMKSMKTMKKTPIKKKK
jgi:hypothetical protein